MNTARKTFLVVASMEKLWAVGGTSCDGESLSSVEVYDPDANTWSYVTSMNKSEGWVIGGSFSM